ncbi:MAG: DUF1501 domain-containing protein [Acidobacteriota bacterium]
MSKQTRRDFMKTGAGAAGAGMMLPVLNRTARGTTIVRQLTNDAAGNGNVLVIVELGGGNDGLNMIVPLKQYATYTSLRPRIAHPQAQILPLYGSNTFNALPTMGMTPDFATLKPVFDAGKVAVIQSAHYPNPNLSHESSRRNYYTGIPSSNIALSGSGWIGRHSALFGDAGNSLDTIGIGGVNKTLYAAGAKVAGVNASSTGTASGYSFNTTTNGTNNGERNNQINAAKVIDTAVSENPYDDLWETTSLDAIAGADQVTAASATPNLGTYPTGNNFYYGLRLIAKLIASTSPIVGTRVFYISLGGFDTHANQNGTGNPNTNDQATLHQRLAAGLKAFYDDLALLGWGNKVAVMVWSEFGRRIADNASFGTDHGTANDILLLGGAVKGGVYGPDPDLTNLTGGNLRWYVDFRSVYTELITKWLGGDPVQVLNGTFPELGFL